MKFVKTFEKFKSSFKEEIEDICLDLKDIGLDVSVDQLIQGENPFSETNQVILIEIKNFGKGYLSSFGEKDVIETLQRIENFCKLNSLKMNIFTHKENHSNQEEELKIYGGGLMDLDNNYLDYKMYWLEVVCELKQ